MTRFLLRRDRIKLPAWVGGMGVFILYIGTALPGIAPTEADLQSVTTVFTQPVGRLFTGPAFGMEHPTYERFFAVGYAPYLFVLAALMNIMLITRHTRAEEQTGRAELLRATATGRHTALAAALIVAAVTNALATLVVTGLAIGVGFAGAGSILVGVGTGVTGMAFAGITAVSAQLAGYSRTAAGLAGAALGASFMLRALGDMAAVGGSALSWISPLGWPAQTAPYVLDRWTPLLLSAALAAVAVAAAFLLQSRRDFGAGLIAARPGPARAQPLLGTPIGLAARLQRGALLGWGAGITALGIVDGAFTQALADAGENMPPALQQIFGHGALVTAYLGFLTSFTTVLIAAYTVFAMQTLRHEEIAGRADLVLATPTSRRTWLGSHTAAVACGSVVIAVVAGGGTGVAAAIVTGQGHLVGDTLAAHLAAVPASLLLLAVWAALIGWAPRSAAPIGWAAVALIAVIAFFAELLRLPKWLVAISPLDHLPQVPLEPLTVTPIVVILGLAAAIVAFGLAGVSWRQIVSR